MMVGRNPDRLDAHGVARACVESVGENLTDGVLSTLFWAGIGLFFFGYPRTSWKIGRLRVKTMTENRNTGDEERFIATELSQSLHVPVTRRN